MTTPVRVAYFLRRSDPSGGEEVSIPEQRKICDGRLRKFVEPTVFVEAYTQLGSAASSWDCPEFLRMIADAEAHRFDCLIVYDLSRFSRADDDEIGFWRHRLQRAGVRLIPVMDEDRLAGPAGRFARVFYQASNRDKLITTSRDVVRGQIAAVERGCWSGGMVPYGYRGKRCQKWIESGRGRRDSVLVIHDDEARVIQTIFDLYNRGWGGARIAAHLTDVERAPARKHGGWSGPTIRTMLGNPIYKGVNVRGRPRLGRPKTQAKFYTATKQGAVLAGSKVDPEELAALTAEQKALLAEGVESPVRVPAIVSEETWERAQRLRVERNEVYARKTGGRPRLLAGIARCGVCRGAVRVIAGTTRPKTGKRYSYLGCVACVRRNRGWRVLATKVEDAVLGAVRESAKARDPDLIARRVRQHLPSLPRTDLVALETRRGRLAKRLSDLLGETELDYGVVKERAKSVSEEMKALDRDIEAARRALAAAPDLDKLVSAAVEAARNLAAPPTPEGELALKGALAVFVQRLEISPAPRGQPKPVTLEVRTAAGVALAFTPSLYTGCYLRSANSVSLSPSRPKNLARRRTLPTSLTRSRPRAASFPRMASRAGGGVRPRPGCPVSRAPPVG